VSNKVPGQAEKWDDVIRQLTSVWTPESAARVLAAIAQLDLHGSSSEGDVLTRVGDKFVPRTVSGGGVTLPLSVVNEHGIEVFAVAVLGGATHRQESGQNFGILQSAEDSDHQYFLFQAGDTGITFNLSDFFGSYFAVRSRGSNSRLLLQLGYNDSGEAILGFATGRVGFFGTTGVTRPEVPASPTVQDVVDALKALGLITQAA
jgi:hypothetical protein